MYCTDYLNEDSKKLMKKKIAVSYKSDCNLTYKNISNGTVLPGRSKEGRHLGGVVDGQGHFVASSAWNEGKVGGGYRVNLNSFKQRNENVIYIGYFCGIWGHILTDCLKKLWFLFSPEGKKFLQKGYKIIYVTMDNKPLPRCCNEIFHLTGIEINDCQRVSEIFSFQNVIVPDNSLYVKARRRYFTKEYADIIARIENNVINENNENFKKYKKIYLTRTQLEFNKDFGESIVEQEFRKNGFKIISPEKYSVTQQISFMLNADVVVATEGSISHNVIFCRPQTNIVILRKSNYANGYTLVINECKNLNVTYIDANHTINLKNSPKWGGPFYLCVTRHLRKYLNKSVVVFPFFLRLSYWKYCIYLMQKKYN